MQNNNSPYIRYSPPEDGVFPETKSGNELASFQFTYEEVNVLLKLVIVGLDNKSAYEGSELAQPMTENDQNHLRTVQSALGQSRIDLKRAKKDRHQGRIQAQWLKEHLPE